MPLRKAFFYALVLFALLTISWFLYYLRFVANAGT